MWKAIGADKTVLSWICYGYELHFDEEPEQFSFPNAQSYAADPSQKAAEMTEGVADGSFQRVHEDFAHVINSLLIEERNGKMRLCHNMQYPNSFLAESHFRMMTLRRSIQHIVRPGDELLVLDLEKAYYHVPMAEASWPYLCFRSEEPPMVQQC